MTDAQIVIGIMQNDNRAWQYICRNMKKSFASIIGGMFSFGETAWDDVEDIFQESCVILMQKVKEGGLVVVRDGAIFSYLVQIGKLTAFNLMRKRNGAKQNAEETPGLIPSVSMRGTQIPDVSKGQENTPGEVSISEKQQLQNEFLDRVFDSIPDECKMLLKKFYWDHSPMDEIACMLGLRNADTAKTKKNRCMNKFREIASQLLNDGEYAEEVVRAAIERAALRELLEDERVLMNNENIRIAALDNDDDKDGNQGEK